MSEQQLLYHLPQLSLELRPEGSTNVSMLGRFAELLFQHPRRERQAAGVPRLALQLCAELRPDRLLPANATCIRHAYRHRVFSDGTQLYFYYDQGNAMARVPGGARPDGATLYLTGSEALDVCFAFYFFFPLLEFMLSHYGIFAVHAAALATTHGTALLLGDSGAGKTTLALELWRQGATLLSEDRPLLTSDKVAGDKITGEKESVRVLPSFGGPKLTKATHAQFASELPALEALPRIEEKVVLSFAQLNEKKQGESVDEQREAKQQACGIYFLERSPLHSLQHSAMAGNRLVARMLELQLFVLLPELLAKEVSAEQFRLLTQLAATADAGVLHYKNDELAAAAGLVLQHLAQCQ